MTIEEFLEVFFGPGNDVKLDALSAGAYGERGQALIEWVGRLREGSPSVLPRLHAGEVRWYGVAFDEASARIQRAELRAFVGPRFTSFAGVPSAAPVDEIEQAVHAFSRGHWVRIDVPRYSVSHVRNALDMLRLLYAERPRRTAAISLPVGRLMRDFQWALRRKDAATSLELLHALEVSGQISATNISYLKVQRLAELELFQALVDLPDLATILMTRRPRRVTEAILRALHSVYVAPRLEDDDYQGALCAFEASVVGRYNALFETPVATSGLPELQLFMAWATVAPQKPLLRERLLAIVRARRLSDGFLEWLASRTDPPKASDKISRAEEALQSGSFSLALSELREAPDGLRVAQLALRCAFETGDPDDAEYSLTVFNGLSEADKQFLLGTKLGQLWVNAVRETAGRPRSWLGLLNAINARLLNAKDLSDVLDRCSEWSPDELVESTELVVEALLEERDPEEAAVMRAILPSLVRAVEKAGAGPVDPRVRPILKTVFMLLGVSESRSEGDLDTLLDLTEALLDGASPSEHRQLLLEMLGIWREEQSRRRLPWLIDFAEVVTGFPQRDPDANRAVRGALVDAVAKLHKHMTDRQVRVSLDILEEMGAETDGLIPPRAERPIEPSREPIPIRTIGIYTLTRSVGERAKKLIESRFPGVAVVVNNDAVATSQLVAVAKNSDVMVVVARSATHAATDAIRQARPSHKPLLFSPGKGSSSLIALVEAYISGLASAA